MKIIVKYWRGTTQLEGQATTYGGAMRIASRNQNAFPPRFYDKDGQELYDTVYGLAYEEGDEQGHVVCAV